MIQPKIVVRNTISGRRPPAPGRREEGIQGGGETPTPQGGGKLTPLPTTGYHLARVSLGGYATFYVSTQSFDDKDKPPAVSRGGACLRPGVGGSLASALGLGASSALRCALGPGCGLF